MTTTEERPKIIVRRQGVADNLLPEWMHKYVVVNPDMPVGSIGFEVNGVVAMIPVPGG